MKIILLIVGIFGWLLGNVLADQVITCKAIRIGFLPGCVFSGQTIEKNDVVSVKTDPEEADANSVKAVQITESSIHSIPQEIFTRFPNLELFWSHKQNVQEIKPDTFANAKKLQVISLWENQLTFLHADTFKGLPNLEIIALFNNKLSALHPQMFSYLPKLTRLDLQNNTCIDKNFEAASSETIENGLSVCGVGYALQEQENSGKSSFEETNKKIDEKMRS
jgi:Leucine-rich repeat (LRR) protein